MLALIGVGVLAPPTNRSLAGEPAPGDVTTFGVAVSEIRDATWAGVKAGSDSRMSAAAPATWGAAIDVPLRVRSAVSPDQVDDVMPTPGAKMSRQVPQLENDARASAESTAPTVMALGALPYLHCADG